MEYWAILSGIEGNLAAYEAVLADMRRSRQQISALYILGDVISPTPEGRKVIERLQKPRRGELEPQVCQGWWEEQLLILYGLGRTGEPTELIERYGNTMVQQLWEAIPRPQIEWIRQLDFGFFELDCLLLHGSSLSVSDELTPESSPIELLDRLMRMDANHLFCGRSGLTFQYEILAGSLNSTILTLEQQDEQSQQTTPRQIIGVGNVGRIPNLATYTLYNPNSNQVRFRSVRYGSAKGFQLTPRGSKTVHI
jgi:hypothetical protein